MDVPQTEEHLTDNGKYLSDVYRPPKNTFQAHAIVGCVLRGEEKTTCTSPQQTCFIKCYSRQKA